MTPIRSFSSRARGRTRVYLAAALVILLVSVAVLPANVSAHAQLVRSTPSAGAILPSAPAIIQLWFSEPVEPAYSGVQVFDAQRQPVDTGSAVAPDDPASMIVHLGDVPPGSYTVAWNTLSTVDGHTARGTFTFAFGAPDQIGAITGAATTLQQGLDLTAVLARWLTYVGVSLALGTIAFRRLVWQPSLLEADVKAGAGVAKIDDLVVRRLGLIFWLGIGLALLGQVEWLVAQVDAVGAGGNADALRILAGTRFGLFLLLRTGLLLVLAAAGALGWGGMALAIGAAVLLSLPLSGHAAATSYLPEIAVVADFIHLAATAVWAGGLPVLIVAIWTVSRRKDQVLRNRLFGVLAQRFSRIGLLSVGALVVTGLWSSWTQVGATEALLQSEYGRALIVKVALVVVVVAIAAVNLLVLRPRLVAVAAASSGVKRSEVKPGSGRASRTWFQRVLIGETVVAALILVLAGALTHWTPAVQDPAVIFGDPLRLRAAAEDLNLELDIRPNRAAENELALTVLDLRRQPAKDVTHARVNLTNVDQDLGTAEVKLAQDGDGRFVTRSPALSIAGNWQAEVVVTRQSGDEVRTTLRFQVPEGLPPQAVRPVFAFPGLTTGVVVAAEAIAGAIILFVAARYLRRRNRRIAQGLLAPAAAVLLLGVGLFARESLTTPASAQALQNPFPSDPASIARGRTVYEQSCLACHGVGGRGDGPLAASLRPRPIDLEQHVTAHSETQLYEFISSGVPGTAMPAFESQLSANDRWDVLNYIVSAFSPTTK